MRIVVVGAGKMGYSIAKLLADGSYDVVVIEQEDERRQIVKDSLDVLTIQGNGCSPEVLDMPEVRNADVFIAVTDSDEVNSVKSKKVLPVSYRILCFVVSTTPFKIFSYCIG